VRFLNERRTDQNKFLSKFTAKTPLSDSFLKFAAAQIEFSYANDMISYPDLREQIVFAEKRPVMSAGYYDFIKTLNLNNPVAFIYPGYNDFTSNYIAYLLEQQKIKKSDLEYYRVSYNLAKEKFTGPAKELLQARLLYQSCKAGHIGFTEKMMADFASNYAGNAHLATLQETYTANKKYALGAPAPDFSFTTITGEKVSLQDLKGKLVYLSFWETNCGLCLMDMPHGQELAKKMADKDIVFLNINMDQNDKAWRDFRQSYQPAKR
jgi:thiol-disulfide isomerase/thioredoxin